MAGKGEIDVPELPRGWDLEARNFEFKVAEWVDDFTCVYLYRGKLDLTEDDEWIVVPGEGWAVEVYDRADTAIWFALDDAGFRDLAKMITRLAAAG